MKGEEGGSLVTQPIKCGHHWFAQPSSEMGSPGLVSPRRRLIDWLVIDF